MIDVLSSLILVKREQKRNQKQSRVCVVKNISIKRRNRKKRNSNQCDFLFLVNCTRMCLAQIHYHTKEESREKIFMLK